MEVGDIIKYELDIGLVLEVPTDDSTAGQALVLWQDDKIQWVTCGVCEVIRVIDSSSIEVFDV